MKLQEIKDKIPTATPAEIVDLSKEFDRTLQLLCEEHDDYRHFNDEYASDIRLLKLTRDPENAKELTWFVDAVIDISERLQLQGG